MSELRRPSPPRPGAPCLEPEEIAALVEGRLSPAARTRVVEHLADCDECRELLAESLAVAREAGIELPAVEAAAVPVHPAARPRRATWIPGTLAAALLIAAALAWFYGPGRETGLVGSSAVARLAADPGTRLGGEWSEPVWSVTRGEGPAYPLPAIAFRLGVRSADLELALARGESERLAARRLAAELAQLAGQIPLADPVASVYRSLGDRLAAAGPVDRARLARDAAVAADLAREAADPELFDLGRWAESGRLAAVAGQPEPLRVWRRRRPPSVADERLRPAIERAAAGSAADLETLIRTAAELP
ncbi:MAG: zf-HC2 domain-containing protein [Thermoanaerobaculia bacterium]